jgi:hypothetical protein
VPPASDSEAKTKIRHQLSKPDPLYRFLSIEKLPKIREILKSCFLSPAFLRPSASVIGNTFLEEFTELSYAKRLSLLDPDNHAVDLLAAKDRCYKLIRQVRSGQKAHPERPQKMLDADLDLLVKHDGLGAAHSSDSLCSFLIGALVWWHLVEGGQCADLFRITDSGKSELAPLAIPNSAS